jgi:Protein of unknown function (DUF3040)
MGAQPAGGEGQSQVPLSEDEQRILQEIEQRFYAHDPDSARRFSSTTLTKYLARNCKWAAVTFLVGFVVLVVSFATSLFLGLFGFVIMLTGAVFFIKNLRRMGQHGWQQLGQSLRNRHVGENIEDAKRRLRRRLGDGPE